jgi:pyrimidine deaminase RibD-like protein
MIAETKDCKMITPLEPCLRHLERGESSKAETDAVAAMPLEPCAHSLTGPGLPLLATAPSTGGTT